MGSRGGDDVEGESSEGGGVVLVPFSATVFVTHRGVGFYKLFEELVFGLGDSCLI